MLRTAALLLVVAAAAACGSNATKTQSVSSSNTQAVSSPAVMYSFGEISFGASLPAGREMTALQADCEICHGREMWASQRLSRATWEAEVTKMIKFGAPVQKSEKAALVSYLARYLGPGVPRIGKEPIVAAPAISYTGPPH